MIIIEPDNLADYHHALQEFQLALKTFITKANKLSKLPIKSITYHVHASESVEEANLQIAYMNMPRV